MLGNAIFMNYKHMIKMPTIIGGLNVGTSPGISMMHFFEWKQSCDTMGTHQLYWDITN